MTHSHESQLRKLAQSLPALISMSVKKEIKYVFDSFSKLCCRVDVVERVVTSLQIEVWVMKRRIWEMLAMMQMLRPMMMMMRNRIREFLPSFGFHAYIGDNVFSYSWGGMSVSPVVIIVEFFILVRLVLDIFVALVRRNF
ncbi:hypothetical protein HAX54_030197 [Datura stramonium]|uniref:Transmembrane protein n=1 Tax=Datura stramonium TaxID=4076 RepID=A0ABS8V7C4_DATST|nr:hypothetical protein [Datura stramonium]